MTVPEAGGNAGLPLPAKNLEPMQSAYALVCPRPGSLSLERRTVVRKSPDHALVRPLRVGICGTDFHIFEGSHPFLQYPRVMGHELAVEVLEPADGTGPGAGEICVVNPYIACGTCHACALGRPNACMKVSVLGVHEDGGMAGLLSLPAANLIPARGLGPDQCAAVEFLAIGAHAVRRGSIAAGERVLVVGTGPIGLGVALFARLSGGEVRIHDHDAERAEAARTITGATPLPEGPDLAERVRRATGGDGFDVVLDATGNRAGDGGRIRDGGPRRPLCAGQRGQGSDHLPRSRFPPQGDDASGQPQRHLGRFRAGDGGDACRRGADRPAGHPPHHAGRRRCRPAALGA